MSSTEYLAKLEVLLKQKGLNDQEKEAFFDMKKKLEKK